MEKQITIEIPEGYSDVVFNKEKNKLEFIKAPNKPKSWKEYCENYPHTGNEYYLCDFNRIIKSSLTEDTPRSLNDITYSDSKEELEAFVTLVQLRQLRKVWVGDWRLPVDIKSEFWSICHTTDRGLTVRKWYFSHTPMVFPTYEMGKEFLECFRDLLEKARILL